MTTRLSLFTGLYIGGSWRRGEDELPVLDPTTGGTLAGAATASVSDCLEAVDAASAAQAGWATTPTRQRSEVLRSCFELMIRERETIADLIQRENGKALNEAVAEVNYAAEFFRWFAEEAVRIGGEFRAAPNGDKQIVVTPEPIGVALLVTPSNFPAAMATRKIAPALAAGCTCVLKPAPETPLTALYLAELIGRAGAPAGAVNVVLPDPPGEAVEAMIRHPALAKLSFTGSISVGRRLLSQAGEQVLRTSMELGGNAPFIVLDDADLDVAVEAALLAKMRNGGASCIAANRIFVHEAVQDQFVEQLTDRINGLKVGYNRQPDADVGALVSRSEQDKVNLIVKQLLEAGGERTTAPPDAVRPGFFCTPTLVAGVPASAEALSTEIFGPVAPVVSFDDIDWVIDASNSTPAGLIAYIIGDNIGRAFDISRRIDAGMIAINRGLISDPAAPFGGFKQSGLGKEGGFEGIDEYLRRKYIGVDL